MHSTSTSVLSLSLTLLLCPVWASSSSLLSPQRLHEWSFAYLFACMPGVRCYVFSCAEALPPNEEDVLPADEEDKELEDSLAKRKEALALAEKKARQYDEEEEELQAELEKVGSRFQTNPFSLSFLGETTLLALLSSSSSPSSNAFASTASVPSLLNRPPAGGTYLYLSVCVYVYDCYTHLPVWRCKLYLPVYLQCRSRFPSVASCTQDVCGVRHAERGSRLCGMTKGWRSSCLCTASENVEGCLDTGRRMRGVFLSFAQAVAWWLPILCVL